MQTVCVRLQSIALDAMQRFLCQLAGSALRSVCCMQLLQVSFMCRP